MPMEHQQPGGSVTLEPSSPSQNTLATASQLHLVETVAVRVLTAAAAARDRGTDAHSQRIVQLAEATTRKLGGSEEEQHLIRLAALLHDIGKLKTPDSILWKPAKLTPEE